MIYEDTHSRNYIEKIIDNIVVFNNFTSQFIIFDKKKKKNCVGLSHQFRSRVVSLLIKFIYIFNIKFNGSYSDIRRQSYNKIYCYVT